MNPHTGNREIVSYDFEEATLKLLHNVVNFYSRLGSYDLVNISHVVGGPWYCTWHHKGLANPGMKIENVTISAFYSKAPPPFSVQ
jgi:uncharacterized phage-associated protein